MIYAFSFAFLGFPFIENQSPALLTEEAVCHNLKPVRCDQVIWRTFLCHCIFTHKIKLKVFKQPVQNPLGALFGFFVLFQHLLWNKLIIIPDWPVGMLSIASQIQDTTKLDEVVQTEKSNNIIDKIKVGKIKDYVGAFKKQ